MRSTPEAASRTGHRQQKRIVAGLLILALLAFAQGPSYHTVANSVNSIRLAAGCIDTSGAANTVTCSTFVGFVGYVVQQSIDLILNNAITGAATIDINGLGVKAITYNGATPMVSGIMVAGGEYRLTYDGTEFVLQGSVTTASGGGGITVYSSQSITFTGTQFLPFGGGRPVTANETQAQGAFPAIKISNFYVQANQNLAAASSMVFTLRDGGVSQAITCTISAGASACSDLVDTFTSAAGDLLDIETDTTGTPGASFVITAQIASAAGGPGSGGGGGLLPYSAISVVLSGGTTPVYIPLGGGGLGSTTEASVQTEVAAVTTFSNVCVVSSIAPGTGNSLVVTLRDGAADTAITLTISDAAVSACDTTDTFTNVANDLMDWSLVPSGVIALFTPNLQLIVQTGTLTAGTINAGTANQTAYYPANGTTLSGGGPGTAGQCWMSNGAGTPPSMQACGGGGGSVSFAQPYATDGVNFFAPIFQVVKPLDTSWINQNGATRTTTNGSVFISLPTTPGGTDNITCRVMANASSTYTITVGMIANFITSTGGSSMFTIAGDSGSGKLILNGSTVFGSNAVQFASYIAHATSPTTNLASAQNLITVLGYGPVWYRIQDDGTNALYSTSRDGINFIQVFSEPDTAFLPVQPADEVGFCAENLGQAQSIPFGLTVFHMSLTSP